MDKQPNNLSRYAKNQQQLNAANQQLRAANQQLQASQQQLKASNQQLQASQQQLRANEIELRRLNHNLQDRVKELDCLHNFSRLLGRRNIPLDQLLQQLVGLIPPAWQYPEATAARIVFKDKEFQTDNFKHTPWMLSAAIDLHGKKAGSLEVCYLEEKSPIDKGPFIKEEKKLISDLAQLVSEVAEHKLADEAVKAANQQLNAANQQLNAANQQLQASQQQLNAANQQLKATNQQLQASQQQLNAANQQLKATNQQLQASQQQLNAANQQLKATNQQLQASKERLTRAQRIAHLGNWDWNLQTNDLFWSDELYRIHKLPEDSDPEYRGRWSDIFVHPDHKAIIKKAMQDAINGTKEYDCEVNIVCLDGEIRTIHTQGEVIRDDSGNPIRFVGTALDITERKHVQEKLLKYQEQLRSLASELSLAEERERQRIAAEFHDRIGQILVFSKLNLDTLCASAHSDEATQTLKQISNMIGQAIHDTRSLTFHLSSPILYELGLEAALAELLREQFGKCPETITEFDDDGLPKPLKNDVRVLIYQVVREILVNVTKHASARKIKMAIKKDNNKIRITVTDNGVGFDPEKTSLDRSQGGGFGIFSIRERLGYIGGQFEIASRPGHGTRATLAVPLSDS